MNHASAETRGSVAVADRTLDGRDTDRHGTLGHCPIAKVVKLGTSASTQEASVQVHVRQVGAFEAL